MDYRKIPRTDLEVSSIALGTWVFGGQGWGGCREAEALKAVAAAAEAGINFIDTAPVYGLGRAEEIVGKALKARPGWFKVATKCGLVSQGGRIRHDLSPASVQTEVEASLRRLGVDTIDLYQCHWPDPQTPQEATLAALERLRSQGKIRYVGVSNFDVTLLNSFPPETAVVTCQDSLSLLDRQAGQAVLSWCRAHQTGFLAYGPLAGGILTGKYAAPPVLPKGDVRRFFYKHYSGPAFERARAVVETLRSCDHPLPQVALNWVRQQEGVSAVLVGGRSAAQVQSNAAAAQWRLTDEQMARLEAAYG